MKGKNDNNNNNDDVIHSSSYQIRTSERQGQLPRELFVDFATLREKGTIHLPSHAEFSDLFGRCVVALRNTFVSSPLPLSTSSKSNLRVP
jgi:hypothetical protein